VADAGTTPRQRYRAQVVDEIKQAALAQISTGGAAALSLNAIAKILGVSGPALYKYFRSRDDLLTALICDGYDDAAAAVRRAELSAAGAPPRVRLHALAGAYRQWALDQPHRYLLLSGPPSPTYHAPAETVDRARAVLGPFVAVMAQGRPWPAAAALVDELRTWIGSTPAVADWIRSHAPDGDPAGALAGAISLWARMHGVVSLEVQGSFNGMGHRPATLYALEVDALADVLALPR
jgi:AcrR family transcriptional regulator